MRRHGVVGERARRRVRGRGGVPGASRSSACHRARPGLWIEPSWLRLFSRDKPLSLADTLEIVPLDSAPLVLSVFDSSLLVYTADNTFHHFLIRSTRSGGPRLRVCGSIGFEGVVQDPRRVRGLSWLVPKSQQRASFSLSLSPTVKTQGCSSRTLTRPCPRARRVRRSGRRPQRRNDHLPHLGPPRPPASSSGRPRGGQVRPADLGRPRRVLLDAPARDRHARELAVGVGRRQDPRLARRAHDREGPGRRQARRVRDGA